jgi:hypothetical protein
MKSKLFIAGCFLAFSFIMLQAKGIEGVWEVQTTKDIAVIENTADGIRAKLGEQGPWYYYEKVSNREFVDKRGNSYRIESNNQLSWESRDRSKSLVLIRIDSNRNPSYRSGKPGYQGQYYSNDYESGSDRRYRDDRGFEDWYPQRDSRNSGAYIGSQYRKRNHIANYMEGKWENQFGNHIIKIRRESRSKLSVKFKHSYHRRSIFIQDPRYPNVFVDRHGHKIILTQRGDLILDVPGYGKPVLRKRFW